VYSPTKGMTSGGHFILYDSLHLTEMIRAYDATPDAEGIKRHNYATNDSHSIDRQLIRMMLAMPDLVRIRRMYPIILYTYHLFTSAEIEFRRRSVFAHIQMVHNVRDAGVGTSMPSFNRNDSLVKETMNERQAALKIAESIMKKYKTNLQSIKKELCELNQTNCYGPGELLDLDFLHNMVEHAI